MTYQLHSKRIYDSKNRLTYELHNKYDEYINKYDNNGNLIYSKNTNLISKEIMYEFSQEFDSEGRLIHIIDYENHVERIYEYNKDNDTVKYTYIFKDDNEIDVQYVKKDDIYVNKVEKITASETVDPLGHKSLYEYDDHGNVSKITDLNEDGTPGLEIYYTNIYE